jgi:hypothetical protein
VKITVLTVVKITLTVTFLENLQHTAEPAPCPKYCWEAVRYRYKYIGRKVPTIEPNTQPILNIGRVLKKKHLCLRPSINHAR